MSEHDTTQMGETPRYYVPHSSIWPIVGSIALFLTAYGAVNFIHQSTEKVAAEGSFGGPIFFLGLATITVMMFGWFGTVIKENLNGMVSQRLDVSYRMGMAWFIISEVMFFAAFFGALFYAPLTRFLPYRLILSLPILLYSCASFFCASISSIHYFFSHFYHR